MDRSPDDLGRVSGADRRARCGHVELGDLIAPLIIFIATYLLIAVQRLPGVSLNRPAATLLGAVAMVTLGGLPLADAYRAIDLNVIVFLLGLLLMVEHLEVAGFFALTGRWLVRRARTPRRLLVAVVVVSGLLSAFFVNDTVCLVLTPILLSAIASLRVRPLPYLLALAMGSNAGSGLTFTGNPQNMLIGVWSRIGFARFSLHMLPVAVGALAVTAAALLLIYRRDLPDQFPPHDELLEPLGNHPPDRPLIIKSLLLFGAMVVAWLAGASLPLAAIAAGALMLALAQRDPAPVLARIQWSLLLFFAALFVVMRGLDWSGYLAPLEEAAASAVVHGGPVAAAGAISGAMLILSNLISNVPAVLLWQGIVPALPHPEFAWEVLAMSATLAGNLLLIGSMANLIVAERAEAEGVTIGFGEYARAGVPVTVVSIAWGVVVLVVGAAG
ncbi:MAG TPA: SLC13 family permease [Gemmatimonadales bacterium]|nr:SLC13 family permease [Gemmatimonadales bacterium]